MRIFVYLLILALLLFNCSQEERRVFTVAVFISGESRMEKVKGFLKGLEDYKIPFRYEIYKGDNSIRSMEELAQKLQNKVKEYDLVATGGSIETFILKKYGINEFVPIVLLGGTAIKQWGLTESFSKPTYNITGIDNRNAELMAKRVELFKRLFPEVNKVIIFCTPKFEASKYAARITINTAKSLGIKVVPVYVKDLKELEFVVSHMKEDGFGAIIMTPCYYTDNFLTGYILQYARFYKVPVFCHSLGFVKKGCPIGYGTSGYDQGYHAAFLAYRILKGSPVSKVPFERVYYPKLMINETSLTDFGINLSRTALVYVDEVIR